MSTSTPLPSATTHHALKPMRGRDPREAHRAATPLELLYDLTFVVGFGVAGEQLAHQLAEGHYLIGVAGFLFAMFAICWAWINYSWFSSAFDTDDWGFRLATMVQMVGVVVLALGLPAMFHSLAEGDHLDNTIMVLGYVIMRLAMVFLWFRAARQDPAHRSTCLTYGVMILIAQAGWILLTISGVSMTTGILLTAPLILFEMLSPVIAERKGGTPWHVHHIAERYGLLAIIALGEGVIGTVASVSAVVQSQGWSIEALAVAAAGVGLTFGLWWIYFLINWGEALHHRRQHAFLWGYGHMLIFAAIAAVGAGLHVAGYYIEHKAHIGLLPTLLTIAIPVLAFILLVNGLYARVIGHLGRLHAAKILLAVAAIALSVLAALAGFGLTTSLIILTLAPALSVAVYEIWSARTAAST